MKILIAAGGTGGHIYPGIAIANKIKKELPEAEIVFVGSRVGMEKDIIPQYNYPIEFVRARGFERQLSLETLAAIKGIFDAIWDARGLLKKHKPNLVIGTGGFTCGVLLFIAAKSGIPTLVHEQNAYPGKTNLILGKYVDKIALAFKEASKYFSKSKLFVSGNPVRDVFKNINKELCKEELGILPDQKMILIMGGSQGAGSVNKASLGIYKKYMDSSDIVFYHLAGKDQYAELLASLEKNGISIEKNPRINILPYSEKVHVLMGAATLVLSRSGAMSVVEIAAVGVPSILVPYPLAAGDHQTFNARVLSDKGGALLIEEKILTDTYLLGAIDSLLNSPDKLMEMSKITYNERIIDADDRIFCEIIKLIEQNKKG